MTKFSARLLDISFSINMLRHVLYVRGLLSWVLTLQRKKKKYLDDPYANSIVNFLLILDIKWKWKKQIQLYNATNTSKLLRRLKRKID